MRCACVWQAKAMSMVNISNNLFMSTLWRRSFSVAKLTKMGKRKGGDKRLTYQ